jgi:hypothetical protein
MVQIKVLKNIELSDIGYFKKISTKITTQAPTSVKIVIDRAFRYEKLCCSQEISNIAKFGFYIPYSRGIILKINPLIILGNSPDTVVQRHLYCIVPESLENSMFPISAVIFHHPQGK